MDSHQLDIVSLAWCRELGLAHDALRLPGTRTVRAATDTIRLVRLGSSSALVAPQWFLDRAAGLDDDELFSRPTLIDLTRDHRGLCTGPQLLAFASQIGDAPVTGHADDGSDGPLVARDLAHVRQLEALCPPDDVTEAGLSGHSVWFTMLDEDHTPLAAAAHSEWQGIVARTGVLTAPGARLRGHATVVGRLCTDDALDEGMIPQWSAHPDNVASRRLAEALDYEELGAVVEVTLPTD